ncbi:MAG: sigma-70 family RNA polymerase sigma factor [Planctomycetota bacterium]|nr:sigma-70 family RNA polymerase sigma factor [Planctomycetota bacterium]
MSKNPTELVTGALQQQATELLAHEEPALRRVLWRYVRSDSTVDDLFQEVSIKVLRRIDTVRDRKTLRGWLFQLARNTCLDYLRAQGRKPGSSPAPLPQQQAQGDLGRNPSEAFLSSERIAAVHKALEQLPGSQQEVIRLRIEDDLDHQQIADKLGISRQAVEVRLCRGRAALKSQLADILAGDL